jgi:hypothetical protein
VGGGVEGRDRGGEAAAGGAGDDGVLADGEGDEQGLGGGEVGAGLEGRGAPEGGQRGGEVEPGAGQQRVDGVELAGERGVDEAVEREPAGALALAGGLDDGGVEGGEAGGVAELA